MKKTYVAVICLAMLTANAFADSTTDMKLAGVGVGAKVSTLGLGLEGIKPINNKLDLRLGVNKFDYDADETLDGTDYKAKLGMQTVAALADFRPVSNGFFVSGGVMMNDNNLDASATVTATDPVTIGTKTITSGTVTSGISFDDMSPYVGIGYRKPAGHAKGWAFTTEAGILLQGDPKITVKESTGTVAQSDIDAEIESVRDDVDALKNLPVISLGAVYNF